MAEPTIVVKIERQGNLIRVTPGLEAILGPELRYSHVDRSFERVEKVTTSTKLLYTTDASGSVVAPAGLTERICGILLKYSYQYQIRDLRTAVRELPDYSALGDLRYGQDEALAAIAASDHGVIEAPTAYGKSHLVRLICRMYPKSRIVSCVPGIPVMQGYYRRMLPDIPASQIGLIGDGHKERDRRITLTTKQSLLKADLRQCDLFLFDEVHEAAAPVICEMVSQVQRARMFGFSASPTGRSDNADPVVEALFGPVIYSLSYQEAVKGGLVSQIYFRMNPVRTGPKISENYKTRIGKLRNGIWLNESRNLAISEVVRRYDDKVQVLIVVDTAVHAFALRHFLPEYKLCYDRMSDASRDRLKTRGYLPADFCPMTGDERMHLQEDFESRRELKVIATPLWNVGVDFVDLEALVRADGGVGEIDNVQIPGRLSRLSDDKAGGILEDFDDSFDEYLHRRALARRRSYLKRGWQEFGVPVSPYALTVSGRNDAG